MHAQYEPHPRDEEYVPRVVRQHISWHMFFFAPDRLPRLYNKKVEIFSYRDFLLQFQYLLSVRDQH